MPVTIHDDGDVYVGEAVKEEEEAAALPEKQV